MKIMVHIHGLSPQLPTGIDNYAMIIVKSFAPLVDEVIIDGRPRQFNHFWKPLNSGDGTIRYTSDPAPIVCGFLKNRTEPFQTIGHLLEWLLRRLHWSDRWARRKKCDVVFYPSNIQPLWHYKIPVVTTIHAILPQYTETHMKRIRTHVQWAKAIVTSWPHPRKDLIGRFPELSKRVFQIPFSCMQHIQPASIEKEPLPPDVVPPFYLYPGFIAPRKNHEVVVHALSLLKKRGGEWPQVVCPGPDVDGRIDILRQLACDLGVADKILFLGHVSTACLAALYAHCRACLSASKAEAGIAVLQEGSGCGKPVICPDIQAARDHAEILHARPRYFIPDSPESLAEQIVELETRYAQYKEWAQQAQYRVLSFDELYMGSCFRDVFSFVIGRSACPDWFPFYDPDCIEKGRKLRC